MIGMPVVKLEHRDPETVLRVRVDFSIAVLVGNHLTALGEVHIAAVTSANVFPNGVAVAIQSVPRTQTRRTEGRVDLVVITAREVEPAGGLLFVQPERNIDVQAHRTILIVPRPVLQRRELRSN